MSYPGRTCFSAQGFTLIFILGLLLSACSPASSTPPPGTMQSLVTRQGVLTPYRTSTPSAAPTPLDLTTPTPPPAETPAPRTHTVQKGEDMGAIAWMYQVSLEELKAANPDVLPNLMSIGTVLVIPPSKTAQPDASPQAETALPNAALPSPTLIPVETGSLACYRVDEGGIWCYLPVHNNQSFTVEGLTALIHIAGSQPEPIYTQPAFSLIDTLPPGAALPLAAYFPPDQVAELIPPYTYRGEIISALPNAADGRYLPVGLAQQKTLISEDGLTASVSVEVTLQQPDGEARRLWIAGVAYDAHGNVVGVRRWENAAGRPLQSGQPMPVSLFVYSTAGEIERVDLIAEARP